MTEQLGYVDLGSNREDADAYVIEFGAQKIFAVMGAAHPRIDNSGSCLIGWPTFDQVKIFSKSFAIQSSQIDPVPGPASRRDRGFVIEVFLGSHFGRVAVGDLIKNRMLGQHTDAGFLAVLVG